ncbi:MAG: HAD family hydrolase [Candidatus Taylorbacteria bacterium]|nr:HAD family hydrolase [Candidatus Taylorbacteria bacterium]
MKYKLIIFDLDGVICDSPKLVNDFFMNMFPTMTQEHANEILCGNFHDELEKFKLTNKKIEETPEEEEMRRNKYMRDKENIPLYDGIKELLEKLRNSGCIVAINTSALEKNTLPVLEKTKIRGFIDFIACAEVSKSKVEKFKIIQEKYKVAKEEIVFVTDTLGDIREADISGIPTITVTYGAHNTSFLTREHHENLIAVVNSVSELGDLL